MPYSFNNIKLIDCTLRDGGYYNNWEFEQVFVDAYIRQCSLIGIDIIELGYIRFTNNHQDSYGNLAKKNISALKNNFNNNEKIEFAAMVDAQDMFSYQPADIVKILHCICGVSNEIIKYIRIAVNYKDLALCLKYFEILQESNLNLCVNLMQIELATEDELLISVDTLKRFTSLSAVYIADSFGSFLPFKLQNVIELFKNSILVPLGFHGHNNLGLGISNSLCAATNGVSWIDVTMYGMGRGAGNTQTEQILPLIKPNISKKMLITLYEFINKFLQPLKDQYQWGTSPLYGIAGVERIHPLYIQISQQQNIDNQKIIRAFKKMSGKNFQKYSENLLYAALNCNLSYELGK